MEKRISELQNFKFKASKVKLKKVFFTYCQVDYFQNLNYSKICYNKRVHFFYLFRKKAFMKFVLLNYYSLASDEVKRKFFRILLNTDGVRGINTNFILFFRYDDPFLYYMKEDIPFIENKFYKKRMKKRPYNFLDLAFYDYYAFFYNMGLQMR